MAEALTHKDLAKMCEVSETTIKSYRRKFPGFIPVLTRGKPIRFRPEAGPVCLQIRDCFAKGMSINETYKVLKESFKKYDNSPKAAAAAVKAGDIGITTEYLEKFFTTSAQMTSGMAQLATAQAKTDRRLDKLEKNMTALLDAQRKQGDALDKLIELVKERPAAQAASSSAPPRAKKIVITGKDGEKAYTLKKEETTSTPPPASLLEAPIVIRNEQGEFLGMPGRLDLRGFCGALEIQTRGSGAVTTCWSQVDEDWVFTMTSANKDEHRLYFTEYTTPRGNKVALMQRLDVNGEESSQAFLQQFFRNIKDKLT